MDPQPQESTPVENTAPISPTPDSTPVVSPPLQAPSVASSESPSPEGDQQFLTGFSWGYFALPLYYSNFMRFPAGEILLYLVAALFQIYAPRYSLILAILAILVRIILFFIVLKRAHGARQRAYAGKRKWKDWQDFVNCQNKWDLWGKILTIWNIIITLEIIGLLVIGLKG